MAEFIQIATTLPSREHAESVARQLVEQRWAACVQISGPVVSIYRWQQAIHSDEEWICTAKTRAALFEAVCQAIQALHPYEVPELIAVPLVAVSPAYADWLAAEVPPRPVND